MSHSTTVCEGVCDLCVPRTTKPCVLIDGNPDQMDNYLHICGECIDRIAAQLQQGKENARGA